MSCSHPPAPQAPPPIDALIVVTRAGPNTYMVSPDGSITGLDHDLALLFGEFAKRPVHFVVCDTLDSLRQQLLTGNAQFAAAALYRGDTGSLGIIDGPPYQDAGPVLVYQTDHLSPRDWNDLSGQTVALLQSDPAQSAWVRAVRTRHPEIKWEASPTANEDKLIQTVAQGKVPYAIADSTTLSLVRNIYLNVDDAFPAAPAKELAWAFAPNMQSMAHQAISFFATIKQDGTLQRLLDRYYGHSDRIETTDASIFHDKVRELLPALKTHFQYAQELSGIDWRLLASIAYVESQWNPLATSPTNVRGLMMLTQDTAQSMNVIDRLDPRQSIVAGAHYFLKVRRLLPDRILEPDRTWMALAAYNIGLAHLEDSRVLARARRLNPDAWEDLRKTLPLLAKPEVAKFTKHGVARGGAPVVFVESIRAYYDILLRIEPPYTAKFRVASSNKQGRRNLDPTEGSRSTP